MNNSDAIAGNNLVPSVEQINLARDVAKRMQSNATALIAYMQQTNDLNAVLTLSTSMLYLCFIVVYSQYST